MATSSKAATCLMWLSVALALMLVYRHNNSHRPPHHHYDAGGGDGPHSGGSARSPPSSPSHYHHYRRGFDAGVAATCGNSRGGAGGRGYDTDTDLLPDRVLVGRTTNSNEKPIIIRVEIVERDGNGKPPKHFEAEGCKKYLGQQNARLATFDQVRTAVTGTEQWNGACADGWVADNVNYGLHYGYVCKGKGNEGIAEPGKNPRYAYCAVDRGPGVTRHSMEVARDKIIELLKAGAKESVTKEAVQKAMKEEEAAQKMRKKVADCISGCLTPGSNESKFFDKIFDDCKEVCSLSLVLR